MCFDLRKLLDFKTSSLDIAEGSLQIGLFAFPISKLKTIIQRVITAPVNQILEETILYV